MKALARVHIEIELVLPPEVIKPDLPLEAIKDVCAKKAAEEVASRLLCKVVSEPKVTTITIIT